MDAAGFILICLVGWMNKNQQNVIEYLKEEVGALKEHLGANTGDSPTSSAGDCPGKLRRFDLGN